MDDTLLQQLQRLPGLTAGAHGARPVVCKLCGRAAALFDVVDLHKHCSTGNQYSFGLSGIEVSYHRCAHCGFLFTDFFDQWTQQECARFIYNDDYVLVDPDYTGARPVQLAAKMARILRGAESLRILDYGSGSGIFAQEMRRAGFDRIESFDPFSSPTRPDGIFDLVTCFEVLEHMFWPEQAITDMLSWLAPSGCLVFSQTVQPPDIATVRGAWWYMAPRNGHVSMFTVETMHRLLPSPGHVLHGNGWLWAFAPAAPPLLLASALATIGPPIVARALFAPADGDDDEWHGAETGSFGRFRWSRTNTLRWRLQAPAVPACLQLRIPVMLAIEPGFAARCELWVDDVQATVTVAGGEILAEIDVDGGDAKLDIILRTPTPRSPLDVRGAADARCLGLAIMTE